MQYLVLFILTTNLSFASCTFVVNLMEKCPSKAQIASMEYQKKFFAELAAKKAANKKAASKKVAKLNVNRKT